MLKFNIIIPYRPLSVGSRLNPLGEIRQLEDGKWKPKEPTPPYWLEPSYGRQDLYRAIRYINKNSFFKHNIIVAIDDNIFPNGTFLKEFDNVRVVKSSYKIDPNNYSDKGEVPLTRMAAANMTVIDSLDDEDWMCYSFIEDLIAGKLWDKYIIDAIEQYGDGFIYVPMFVEAHGGLHSDKLVKGLTATPDRIWNVWRKEECCHALCLPEPADRNYVTEKDFDNYIPTANEAHMPLIIEPCGLRNYGYYAVMFMKAKIPKRIRLKIGYGFDLDFDNRLYSEGGYQKVVVTNSFVLHPIGSTTFKTEEELQNERTKRKS